MLVTVMFMDDVMAAKCQVFVCIPAVCIIILIKPLIAIVMRLPQGSMPLDVYGRIPAAMGNDRIIYPGCIDVIYEIIAAAAGKLSPVIGARQINVTAAVISANLMILIFVLLFIFISNPNT